jgi:hypothetical protein
MEQSQKTIRRLVALAVLVLPLAGVPHFRLDRKPIATRLPDRRPIAARLPDRSYEYLLPATIGKFHVVNRWRNVRPYQAIEQGATYIEQGATYQDSTGKQTAQFAILLNYFGDHNALGCYLTRGMALRENRTEQAQAADSPAKFDVGFFGDQSLNGAEHSTLFVASTVCRAGGCLEAPSAWSSAAPHVAWSMSAKTQHERANLAMPISLSITFQSLGSSGETQDQQQQQALLQFRELVSNFKLIPLRELAAAN